jgi:hypothetical protein
MMTSVGFSFGNVAVIGGDDSLVVFPAFYHYGVGAFPYYVLLIF